MGLNIKNDHVHDLAQPDAATRLARVHAILADVDHRLTDEDRAALSTDDLYDDAGLPR